ncbi:MAG: DUF2807 domain-containing protein [Bacteroidetes bacterium]|nr:DUF2807 domain-containing protein [Bacteroidota bacterium]
MKKLLSILCAGSLLIASCKSNGSKEGATTENRSVTFFNAIEISAPLDADITVGGTTSTVQLKGDKKLLEKIKVEVKGDRLVISKDDGIWPFHLNEHLSAVINVPSLTALEISGASDANVKGDIKTSNFTLDVSGAGDVTLASLTADNFTSSLSGAGDLTINGGTVGNATFRVTGAGDVAAFPLVCKQVETHVAGAGDIELTANEKLDVHIAGAGSVTYKGAPSITSDIKGAGSLEKTQ